MWRIWFFFFFQAEDGIRDLIVTGVQTCALPIWARPAAPVEKAIEPVVADDIDADLETAEVEPAEDEEEEAGVALEEAEEEDEEMIEDASELGEDEDDMAEVIDNVEEEEP